MTEERHKKHEQKRVQVAQIKCRTDNGEDKLVREAIETLQRAHGYASAREAFVASLLAAAKKVRSGP